MPTEKKQFNFKIGADPEFILTMQGRKVDARQTMSIVLKNKKDFIPSRDNMGFDVGDLGSIGWDGANSTGEIRPSASYEPQDVVNNIGGIFKKFIEHMKLCDMSTLSEYSSIGGHIHFEIPKGEKWSKEKNNTIQRKLASFYLPLLISENKTNLNIRLTQKYGSLKDYRVEQHFTYPDGTPGYTMEFRCPSAEWLTTPKIAKATLAYMGVVYHEIMNNPKNFAKFNDIIYKSDKQGDALQTLAIMEFEILTESIMLKARKYIRTFEMYPTYKNEIEYLFNPKQVIKDKQKVGYNIGIGWNLIGKTLPKKSEILCTKKRIQEIAETKDFDILKESMNVSYNEDTNVALYAEALKDRVAAFNWKLKNNYYLFGMRKGINEIIVKNLKGEYLHGKNLIKTILDKDALDNLFYKMEGKFQNSDGVARTQTLDFTTGKVKDMREAVIMIGLPYDMRRKEEMKDFLSLIWSIENGEIPKKLKKEERLRNDTDGPAEQYGEIYKILSSKGESAQVVMDSGSTSLRNHMAAIENVIMEGGNILN